MTHGLLTVSEKRNDNILVDNNGYKTIYKASRLGF